MPDPAAQLQSLSAATAFANIVAALDGRDATPPLVPKKPWEPKLSDDITDTAVACSVVVRSGLLLWNDDLDRSHTISQGMEDETGSYWHGIMHRREPDYSNAKYWFRRVGDHPAFRDVYQAAVAVANAEQDPSPELKKVIAHLEAGSKWDPFKWVDWCEQAERTGDDGLDRFLRQVQLEEIRILLIFSITK